jgi:hypothetical protein
MVVESGAADLGQLQACFERQVLCGGDLGTAMLELGMLPEEQLHALWAHYHELQSGPQGPLPMPNAEAQAALGPELAARYHVLPLSKDERALTLAVSEPLDMAATKELRAAVKAPIKAAVVLPMRLTQALNRYGSVPLQPRVKQLILSLDGSVPVSERPPPMPPEPQLPYRRMSEHPEGVVPSTRHPRRARPTTKSEADTAPPPPSSLTRSGSTVPFFNDTATTEIYTSESVPPSDDADDLAYTNSEAETVPPSQSAEALEAAANVAVARATLPPEPMRPSGPPASAATETVPPRPLAEPPPHLADSAPPPRAADIAPSPRAAEIAPPPGAADIAPPPKRRQTDKFDLREAETVPPPSESVEPTAEHDAAVPSERPDRTTNPWEGSGEDYEQSRKTAPWTDDEDEDDEPLRDSTEPAQWGVPEAASSIRSRFSASLPPSEEDPSRRWVHYRYRGPFTSEAARQEVDGAEDADQILQILVRYARQYFERVMLFAVNDDQAELRLVHAIDPPLARVSLAEPSLLRNAYRSGQSVLAELGEDGVDGALRDTLDLGDQEVAVVPVYIRGRVVALLYGDDAHGEIDVESVDAVGDFAEDAATAIARVIVERKRDG